MSASKVKPKENNVRAVDKNKIENNEKPKVNNANEENKTQLARPEEFKTPKKFARVAKDLPPVQTCTTQNSFVALETVKNTEDASDPPLPVMPKIKPIMLRINKNYNIILQEIFRKYPNTVNKSTGDYIKTQPKLQEDNDNINKLLEIKKAQFYTKDVTPHVKVVIKRLPIDTAVEGIVANPTMGPVRNMATP
ncbi:hypothetical protein TNCT_496061 [Trichonephila clavata]|uniref:Uncharacterized protein n=1 Tax=Trichonephila clavata TaxID=2740835 RepID=A0A8X6HZI4_TRICU|nr:hypothetical protein TNCT_496061 [Trichonephila clavata]